LTQYGKIEAQKVGLDPFEADFDLSDRFLGRDLAEKEGFEIWKSEKSDRFWKWKMSRPKRLKYEGENGNLFSKVLKDRLRV
jgi:hypothetical protein